MAIISRTEGTCRLAHSLTSSRNRWVNAECIYHQVVSESTQMTNPPVKETKTQIGVKEKVGMHFIQSFAPRSSGALSHTGEPSKKAESKNFHQLLSAAATSSYFFLLSTIAKRKMEKSTASCKAASKYYEQTLLFAHNTTPIFCSVVCPVHTNLRRAQLFGKCVWHARASAVAW